MVRLEIVLLLTQDKCMVFAECTTGSEIVLESPDVLLGDVNHVEPHFSHLETVLVSVQDRCMVCTKRTIGSEIILGGPNGTPR